MKRNERPCPNCGERGTCIEQYARDYGVGSRYHIACANCGARGPAAKSEHDAAVVWNRRAGEERLLEALELSCQFVAKYAEEHKSVIGQRALDRINAAIDEAKGQAQ